MNDRSTDDDSEKANKKVRREKILVMGSEQRDTRTLAIATRTQNALVVASSWEELLVRNLANVNGGLCAARQNQGPRSKTMAPPVPTTFCSGSCGIRFLHICWE